MTPSEGALANREDRSELEVAADVAVLVLNSELSKLGGKLPASRDEGGCDEDAPDAPGALAGESNDEARMEEMDRRADGFETAGDEAAARADARFGGRVESMERPEGETTALALGNAEVEIIAVSVEDEGEDGLS